MGLETRARNLGGEWERHWSLAGRTQHPVGTIWRLLTTAGDKGRPPSLLELRLIATELDAVEKLLGQQVDRLLALTEEVRQFAEEVNDALADAQPEPVAPEWSVHVNGLDDEAIDRIARFYTDRGHGIR